MASKQYNKIKPSVLWIKIVVQLALVAISIYFSPPVPLHKISSIKYYVESFWNVSKFNGSQSRVDKLTITIVLVSEKEGTIITRVFCPSGPKHKIYKLINIWKFRQKMYMVEPYSFKTIYLPPSLWRILFGFQRNKYVVSLSK